MESWNGTCPRCGKPSSSHTCSYFNTQSICLECREKEEKHPDYQMARDAEREAVIKGDYNFPGIGLPSDL